MHFAYIAVTAVTIVANAGAAMADFARARFVLANSAEVGVPPTWLPALATLKLAGAIGLVAGLVGVPGVGEAAAAGLVLFFVGAVVAHTRAHVFHNIAFPGAYLLLSAASLAFMITR
jgi:hypothetical protein